MNYVQHYVLYDKTFFLFRLSVCMIYFKMNLFIIISQIECMSMQKKNELHFRNTDFVVHYNNSW